MLISILYIVNIFVLVYFALLSIGYIILFSFSIKDIFSRFKEVDGGNIVSIMKSYSLPPVTVIMSTYNEENLINSVESILKNEYLNTLLIIINDGSTDNTMEKLVEKYNLIMIDADIDHRVPTSNTMKGYYISTSNNNLSVIDKSHTDKSDCLNMGLNACKTPLLVTIDADTIIESHALSRIVFYMLSKSDMDAAGGGVYVVNNCQNADGVITDTRMPTNPIEAIQACEYLRSFMFSKSGWNAMSGALCYSGTFTIFKTATLIDVGGFDVNNLAQDFEIITSIRENQYDKNLSSYVGYTPAAVVWTDVPATLGEYWRQRFNWQYFTLDSLMQHKHMLFNPKYGIVGYFTYPFFLFGETLGCLVEFTAYLSIILSLFLGVFDWYTAAVLFGFAWGFFTLMTVASAFLSFNTFNRYRRVSDLFLILFYTLFESLGLRQFNIICRVSATMAYFFGRRKNQPKTEENDLVISH